MRPPSPSASTRRHRAGMAAVAASASATLEVCAWMPTTRASTRRTRSGLTVPLSPLPPRGRGMRPVGLILLVEALILQAYVNINRTTAILGQQSYVTGALVNVQRETLLLDVEIEELPTSRDLRGAQVRRALLANQLNQLRGLGGGDTMVATTIMGSTGTCAWWTWPWPGPGRRRPRPGRGARPSGCGRPSARPSSASSSCTTPRSRSSSAP